MASAKPLPTLRPARRHTAATPAIQRRLEVQELKHLRAVCAEQGEDIERLTLELHYAEDAADFWSRSHHDLAEHLDNGTADARCVGLTAKGELLVIRESEGHVPALEGGAA